MSLSDFKAGHRVIQQYESGTGMPPRHGTITKVEMGTVTIEWDDARGEPWTCHLKDFPVLRISDPLA